MIRFVRLVAMVGPVLFVLTACGGAPAATTPTAPTARPSPTEPPVTTFLPITTPEVTFGPLPSGDDSTGSLDTGNDWPSTVNTTLSPGKFVDEFANGSFTDSSPARNCGSFSFAPSGFSFGFPHDTNDHDVEDVTFDAAQLTPGSATTAFYISVSISEEAGGGVHPATVVDTTDTRFGASGTAQLTVSNGERHLLVDAADQDGISVHLTAVCTPP